MIKKTEEWRPSGIRDDYEISNHGRYRRLKRDGTYHYSFGSIDGKGYLRVCISKKNYPIHRLVCIAFVDGYSDYRNCVNHKDFDKHNNYFENLEWCSNDENSDHAIKGGAVKAIPVVVFNKRGDKVAEFVSKTAAIRFGFTEKYMMPVGEYSKEVAFKKLNSKTGISLYENSFDKVCDPLLKQRVLLDLNSGSSIKDVIAKYGLSYYKVSLLKGTPYERVK